MNYFAHGIGFVDQPYVLAGTAVPDWLNVVDRRVRARRKRALPLVDHADARIAAVARGIVRHHDDDAWFHETEAFHQLQWRLTALVREVLAPADDFRPSFLGHILIEILLDAVLIAEEPAALSRYYEAAGSIDPAVVQDVVNAISPHPTDRLADLIPAFCRERFLSDYLDDAKLCVRLNQVMRRVGLPQLPIEFRHALPTARDWVAQSRDELLLRPGGRNE